MKNTIKKISKIYSLRTNPYWHIWILAAFLFLLFLFSAKPANAEKGNTWLDLNIAAIHETREYKWWERNDDPFCFENCGEWKSRKFNQQNFGLGLTHELQDSLEVKGGFYYNSFYKMSVYGGLNFKKDIQLGVIDVTPGVTLIGATGYNDTIMDAPFISPILLPNMGIRYDTVKVSVGYVPSRFFARTVGYENPDNYVDVVTIQLQVLLK